MKKGISKHVVYKRVLVFATLLLFVAGALTPIIQKADATDDFDWAWSSGSGTTGNLYRTGNVSIGTSTSTHKLVVESSDNETLRLIGNGPVGSWATLNFGDSDWVYLKEYEDDRLRIHAAKSIAMGTGTTASGDYGTMAMGYYTSASGETSTAMGEYTVAYGRMSTAMGSSTNASGDYATAMGYNTNASGLYSTAMGYDTNASYWHSTAMGSETTSSGTASTAMGFQTTASGSYATAMGYGTTASGTVSTALGYDTNASGGYSTAMGHSIIAHGDYSMGIGLSYVIPPWNVSDDHVMSVMGGKLGVGTVSPDANYRMEIQGDPKGLFVRTENNTYESIVGQCHHQYRPAGFVLENRYPASASFPKGVMMRFKGMDTNGVMQEYLAFVAEYVTKTAGAIDGDCWIRPVKNGGANWAFRFTHDGKLLIKDGGVATDLPARALHVHDVMRLEPRATSPSSPSEGDIYYDSSDHMLKFYDGTAWRDCYIP